jgi:hypothetical protein
MSALKYMVPTALFTIPLPELAKTEFTDNATVAPAIIVLFYSAYLTLSKSLQESYF